MKYLLRHFSTFLAIAVLGVPLAWAVSFTGMTIKTVPQLSFDTRSLQADAASPDVLTRSVGAGVFTLKALTPYSKGAVTYSSSAPGVAMVDAVTGQVTPVTTGETTITASQAALAPFPAATARYKLTLTGLQVTYQPWNLPARAFGSGDVDLKLTPPVSDPVHPSAIVYSSATPDVVAVSSEGIVKLLKIGTATVVATQAATGNYAEGKVSATFQVNAAEPALTWNNVTLRLGGSPLQLIPPVSANTDPAATFRYTVEGNFAAVNGDLLTAQRAGKTTITATQKASGNYKEGTVTVALEVQPALVTVTFADIKQALSADATKNVITLKAEAGTLPAGVNPPRFQYTVDDTSVASVDPVNPDKLTLLKAGTAKITATLLPVQFPLLNAAPYVANVNGMPTFLRARLTSFSGGEITYRTSSPALLSLDAGSAVGTLARPREWESWGRVNGLPLNLEVVQAETANYLGQTIRIPNAIAVYSPTEGDFIKRPWRIPNGMTHPGAVLMPDGSYWLPEGATTCPN